MKIFKPIESKGFLWGIGLGLFTGAITAVPVIINVFAGKPNPVFLVIMGLSFIFVTGVVGYFTWAARNLEYGLDNENLAIKWAMNKKVIPLSHVRGVRKAIGNSSMKVVGASWPGFHMGSFSDPLGKGTVNLYAARLWGEIILIRTKWEVIGITPENPEEFLEELNRLVPELEADTFTGGAPVETFSPWKDKLFAVLTAVMFLIFAVTGIYLYHTIPSLPDRIPMHFNIYGEVDRYGSPSEIYLPLGIGFAVAVFMVGITGLVARNNKTSAYMMVFAGLFIAVLFSLISISMTFAA